MAKTKLRAEMWDKMQFLFRRCLMLTFVTFNETIKMGFALKGNGEDERKLNEFFSTVDSVLSAYSSKKSAIPA